MRLGEWEAKCVTCLQTFIILGIKSVNINKQIQQEPAENSFGGIPKLFVHLIIAVLSSQQRTWGSSQHTQT